MCALYRQSLTGGFSQERYYPRVSNMTPPPAWQPAPPSANSRVSRGLTILSLGIALLAIGIAIGAWFRPLPKNEPAPAPTYSSQQVADAKSKVCAAYLLVRKALAVTGSRDGGTDSIATLAVATSSRQALAVGSRYLSSQLDEAPATAADLAIAVRKLVGLYQKIAISYLAEIDEAEIDPLRREAEQPSLDIDRLCR